MKEDFLDKRKIITMAKDLKEAAGIMVYPREDDSIDLSSFIVKKPPQKESVVLEIPLPEKSSSSRGRTNRRTKRRNAC